MLSWASSSTGRVSIVPIAAIALAMLLGPYAFPPSTLALHRGVGLASLAIPCTRPPFSSTIYLS